MRRSVLERELSVVSSFNDPRVEWEQYLTPADIAAHVVHLADIQGDLSTTVVDLGTGTGMLALGAALSGTASVVGIDLDEDALDIACENERRVTPPISPDWVCGDATRPPICPDEPVTVLMNPPFGAQKGNEHADRAFLDIAVDIATVSYSIHNAGSREFVESFAGDHGGIVTHAFAVDLDVPRQFRFHTTEKQTIDAEAYRIEW